MSERKGRGQIILLVGVCWLIGMVLLGAVFAKMGGVFESRASSDLVDEEAGDDHGEGFSGGANEKFNSAEDFLRKVKTKPQVLVAKEVGASSPENINKPEGNVDDEILKLLEEIDETSSSPPRPKKPSTTSAPAKEVVYIGLIGQSNALFRGKGGGGLEPDSRVKILDKSNRWAVWDLSTNPPQYGVKATVKANNPTFHFAKKIALVENREVRVIASVQGGTSISAWKEGGKLMQTLKKQMATIDNRSWDYVVFCQGEKNRKSPQKNYRKVFYEVFAQFQKNGWIKKDTPRLVYELVDRSLDSPSPKLEPKSDFQNHFFNTLSWPYVLCRTRTS